MFIAKGLTKSVAHFIQYFVAVARRIERWKRDSNEIKKILVPIHRSKNERRIKMCNGFGLSDLNDDE